MRVRPVLGDWEIPRIQAIRALERRSFVEFAIPGRVGSVYQDLNTTPTSIAIAGSLFGDENRNEFLETLREKFQEGQPVTFVADITTATAIQHVIIEALELRESGQRPDETAYYIVIKESPPPPPPPTSLGDLDAGLTDLAGDFLESVTGALDLIDEFGAIPDFGDPTRPLSGVLEGVSSALGSLGDATGALNDLFG